jgi:hypothetical protein
MNGDAVFRCRACQQLVGNPHVTLDRNTQQFTIQTHEGKRWNCIVRLTAQEMFRYGGGQACRAQHEPQVVAELELQTTYPSHHSPTPCCRCGAPVDRAQPHVSYGYLEANTVQTATGEEDQVVGDIELAMLCPDCEAPDVAPDAAAEAFDDVQEQEENTRT